MNTYSRRDVLARAGAGAAALAGAFAAGVGWAAQAEAPSGPARAAGKPRPNFVIIIADDLTYHDLGCWGNTDVRTPNLDRLAAGGMKLVNMFTPAPMCAPARQALYTGLYPVRNGAHPNHSRVHDGVKSLPHYLKSLGYRVGLVGKTHFGPPACFPFDYPKGRGGEGKAGKGGKAGKAAKAEKAEKAEAGGEAKAEAADSAGGAVGSAQAMEAMRSYMSDKAQPFCLVVASNEPHSPWTLGEASSYDPAKLKLPPYYVDTPQTRRDLAAYYAEIETLDRQVGQVMRILEQTGQADNTLLLFLSEQGSGAPHAKWTLYDAGIRVAGIARWPGQVKPGSTSAALMQYVDVLPTFIQAAGGTAPADIDGRSFLPVLTGQADACREFVFAVQTSRGIISGPEAYGIRAVRDARYKYILNLHSEADFRNAITEGKGMFGSWREKAQAGDAFAKAQVDRYLRRPEVEFYDLDEDPHEMKNLASDPALECERQRLRAKLDEWMKQQGDKGAATEQEAKTRQMRGGES